MSLKSRTWACPDCDGQFTTIMDDRDGIPKFCQCCGADMSIDSEPIPNFSRISKPQNQTMDRVYRKMEASSYARAEAAAEMAGGDVKDFSNLKMTNMRDNLREGDISYMPPARDNTPTAPPMRQPVQNMVGQAGLATAQMVKSQGGSVGQQVLDRLKGSHLQRAHQMQRAGEMGRATGKE